MRRSEGNRVAGSITDPESSFGCVVVFIQFELVKVAHS